VRYGFVQLYGRMTRLRPLGKQTFYGVYDANISPPSEDKTSQGGRIKAKVVSRHAGENDSSFIFVLLCSFSDFWTKC